ncbi:hypothetical protein Q3G72_013812 [Acer saccharum]|nr:hypothetical protein Q3G72_013812 [Acer saccharum]
MSAISNLGLKHLPNSNRLGIYYSNIQYSRSSLHSVYLWLFLYLCFSVWKKQSTRVNLSKFWTEMVYIVKDCMGGEFLVKARLWIGCRN